MKVETEGNRTANWYSKALRGYGYGDIRRYTQFQRVLTFNGRPNLTGKHSMMELVGGNGDIDRCFSPSIAVQQWKWAKLTGFINY